MKDQVKNKDDKDDLKWVCKAKEGNRKAFEKLVLKYQRNIYVMVRKMIMDHSDANDLVQDTFMKAYLNLHRFNEQYPFYPWLHRIAINTTLNYLTKTSRFRETFADEQVDQGQRIELNTENPLEEIIESEMKEKVTGALQHLPVDQRMIFILRTSEQLSYQEISDRLNISVGTVMSRLSRARSKLKNLLQPYLSENNFKV